MYNSGKVWRALTSALALLGKTKATRAHAGADAEREIEEKFRSPET